MELNKAEKMEQLERVLRGRALQNSESLKSFLRYVVEKTVEGGEAQLKEYTIATEVFGRRSDYDSRVDSVVRVQAGRLRAKLQEYYADEGKDDPVVISLPKGHYHPVFVPAPAAPAGAETLEAPAAGARHPTEGHSSDDDRLRNNGHDNGHAAGVHTSLPPQTAPAVGPRVGGWLPFAAGVVIAALGVGLVFLLSANRDLRARAGASAPVGRASEEVRAVWGPVLADPEPPLLVLSNPAVYRFVNQSDPPSPPGQVIQLTAEQARAMPDTPEFRGQYTMGDGQQPRLIPSLGMYTGMGEAVGLYRLADMFRAAGRGAALKQSRQVSPDDLKYRNVILLGSVYVNEWSGKLPAGETFTYTDAATILNHDPRPGEEREYRPQFDERTGRLVTDYALVTVKPNVSGAHTVTTLAGVYSEGTEAAAEFVTTRHHLTELARGLARLGAGGQPPRHYQALLKVAVENGTPTTITLVAIHPLRGTGR
jgi:hypothetical protein